MHHDGPCCQYLLSVGLIIINIHFRIASRAHLIILHRQRCSLHNSLKSPGHTRRKQCSFLLTFSSSVFATALSTARGSLLAVCTFTAGSREFVIPGGCYTPKRERDEESLIASQYPNLPFPHFPEPEVILAPSVIFHYA